MGNHRDPKQVLQSIFDNVRSKTISTGNIIQNVYNGTYGSVITVLATSLASLSLVASVFLLYQIVKEEEQRPPSNSQIDEQQVSPSDTQTKEEDNTSINPSSETSTPQAEAGKVGVEPGQLVQPALGNKAQVELTAVRRILGEPDKVRVEMRFKRNTDGDRDTSNSRYGTSRPFSGNFGSGVTDVGNTTARNPITSETYKAVDPSNLASGIVSLSGIHQGQPKDGYVVLNVPSGVNVIDIFIPNAGTFKNVPISNAN